MKKISVLLKLSLFLFLAACSDNSNKDPRVNYKTTPLIDNTWFRGGRFGFRMINSVTDNNDNSYSLVNCNCSKGEKLVAHSSDGHALWSISGLNKDLSLRASNVTITQSNKIVVTSNQFLSKKITKNDAALDDTKINDNNPNNRNFTGATNVRAFNAEGIIKWNYNFPTKKNLYLNQTATYQDNIYLAGVEIKKNNGNLKSNAYVVKFSEIGEILWAKKITPKKLQINADYQVNQIVAMTTTSAGYIAVIGKSFTNYALKKSKNATWMSYLNASGEVLWTDWLIAPSVNDWWSRLNNRHAGFHIVANHERIYIGRTDNRSPTGRAVSAYGVDGKKIWQRDLIDLKGYYLMPHTMTINQNGKLLIAGTVKVGSSVFGEVNAWIGSMNSNGNLDWSRFFGNKGDREAFKSISVSKNGKALYLSGHRYGNKTWARFVWSRVWRMKLDSEASLSQHDIDALAKAASR